MATPLVAIAAALGAWWWLPEQDQEVAAPMQNLEASESVSNHRVTPVSTVASATSTETTLALRDVAALSAASLLAMVKVADEVAPDYSVGSFEFWRDSADGCTVRETFLVRESETNATLDTVRCVVVDGRWTGRFDNAALSTSSPPEIDRVVGLREAWVSGAWSWSPRQRHAFANYIDAPRALRVVSPQILASRADRSPAEWMPPNPADWCTYLGEWLAVKVAWSLTADREEFEVLVRLVAESCPPVEGIGEGTTTQHSSLLSGDVNDEDDGWSVYYYNCAEVRAAGADPLYFGEPGYRLALDRDKDGVACE